jgi:hypothetical protein
MAKRKEKTAAAPPVLTPQSVTPEPIDVMDMEIPPETVEVSFGLNKWVGDDSESQTITSSEHYLFTGLTRVMRHGGFMEMLLWKIICYESFCLEFGGRERLSPDSLKQIVDATFHEHAKAQREHVAA